MVRPSVHTTIDTHGKLTPNPSKGIVHFHTGVAHVKEFLSPGKGKRTVRPPQDFLVQKEEEVAIHSLEAAHRANRNGTFTIYYDDKLHPWLEFVANTLGKTVLQ
jgi:hypothetical protein